MDQICPKKVFPVENGKNEYTIELCIFELVSVLNSSLNWQFRIFGPNLPEKRNFRSKAERVNTTTEFCIFELIEVSNFSLDRQFWIFGPNLPWKGIFGLKRKNRIFACVHGHYFYWTFPHRGRQTQRYFNVSSPSSRRDKFKRSNYKLVWINSSPLFTSHIQKINLIHFHALKYLLDNHHISMVNEVCKGSIKVWKVFKKWTVSEVQN